MWLLISEEFGLRSMTEFESFALSKYLVGTWLVGFEKKKGPKNP